MQTPFPKTWVLRHYKENKKKCSLRGLEQREDFIFKRFPLVKEIDFSGMLLLSFEGPQLSKQDVDHSLLLLDGTWRYAEQMFSQIPELKNLEKRSFPPSFKTAYPRKQDDCTLPERGLASVEALAVAYFLLGRPWEDLLDNYHWKEAFLSLNAPLFLQKSD